MTTRAAESPELGLAEGFARHVERWALAQAASASAARAARHAAGALSLAIAEGHVCLLLADLAAPLDVATRPAGPALPHDAATWRQALLASNVVGTPESPGAMPLVLDGDGRLYLHRHFDYERRLAKRLLRAASVALPPADALPRLQQRLNELFAGNAARLGGAADWQKLAAALALRGRLAIISGGPGTGKTTTVVNLLACLIELEPDCRIALAAPTGKAAARMTEAIRLRAAHLPEPIRRLLPTESFTVHRLLGVTPGLGSFMHHAGNPLAIDALVVDEASMLDLALATKLLEAVPETARIVLLGDKDQLAAVESGAVFSELSVDPTLSAACVHDLAALTSTPAGHLQPPAPALPSALRDAAVWFTQNFRFERDSGIGRLATLVNAGDARQALDWLRAGGDAAVRWLDDDIYGSAARSPRTLQCIVDGYAPFIEAVGRDPKDRRAISDAFARFRVLCAVRQGPRGVIALNNELAKRFCAALARPEPAAAGGSAWYIGRPVLVLRNDYVLKLFNGDIGITLPDDSGETMVWFPDADGGFRAITPVRLPQHETAFAMTVHKAQGSEFDQALVLLPERRSRVLTRELLYTGVTRARHSVTVCSSSAMLAAAIGTTTRRHSGLLARLRDG